MTPHVIYTGRKGENRSGISRIVTPTLTGCCGGWPVLLDFRGGQVSHQEKQQCVSPGYAGLKSTRLWTEKTRGKPGNPRAARLLRKELLNGRKTLQRLDQEGRQRNHAQTDATEETGSRPGLLDSHCGCDFTIFPS